MQRRGGDSNSRPIRLPAPLGAVLRPAWWGNRRRQGAAEGGTGRCDTGPAGGPHAGEDPELAAVIDAWPALPRHVRAAMLALLAAADTPAGRA